MTKQFTRIICSNDEPLKIDEVCELLNALHEENQKLLKDNFMLLGLLGDIRAILRTGDVDTVIKKINKLEKEMIQ